MIDKDIFKLDQLFVLAQEFYQADPSKEFTPTLVVIKPCELCDMISFPDFDENRFAVMHNTGLYYALKQEVVLGAVFMGEFWIRDAEQSAKKREAFILFAKSVDQQFEILIAEIDRENGKLILVETAPDHVEDKLLSEFFVGYKLGQQTFSTRVN